MGFIDNFVRSKFYKELTAKLYGMGASVVIVGALFKINHWPGGTTMLIIGMGIEAVIFFVSAFEPLHVTYDWSLVYPELAGMDDIHAGDKKKEKKDKKKDKEAVASNANATGGVVIQGGYSGTQDLDKMLSDAKIGPELIESLGKGLKNLADTTSQLNDVAGAAVASEKFTQNLSSAVSSRLYETRHTDTLGNLFFIISFTATEQDTVCYVYTETAQIIIEHILIKSHCLYQNTACRVWQMDEVEVALHHTILTRLSVDGDISIIEIDMLAVHNERKIVLVNLDSLTIIQSDMPVGTLHIDEINIVALFIKERVQTLS